MAADPARFPGGERHSLAVLLDLIRSGQAVTRLDLERASSFGRAVVADRLATLTGLGLVEEGARGPSMGGRAPRTVRFRSEAGSLLVAGLDRSSLSVGLADLSGRLLFEHHEAADLAAGPGPVIGRLVSLFDWVRDQQDRTTDLWGIGLGVPDAVETGGDDPFALPHLTLSPDWTESLALERLVARYRAPVWVRSATQMATLGECGPPQPERRPDILFVDLGAEISAGLTSGGALHRGAKGIAGQIGHVCIDVESRVVCRCGNAGCLETRAGSAAIVRAACAAVADGRSRWLAEAEAANGALGVADIGLAAQLGDPLAAQLLADAGRLIGSVLAVLVNAVNPSRIILGGELAQTGDILLAAVRKAVFRHAHPRMTRDLQIVRSDMGRAAALAGAALLAVDELFRPGMLGDWIAQGTPLRHPLMPEFLARAEAAMRAGPQPAGRRSPAVPVG